MRVRTSVYVSNAFVAVATAIPPLSKPLIMQNTCLIAILLRCNVMSWNSAFYTDTQT